MALHENKVQQNMMSDHGSESERIISIEEKLDFANEEVLSDKWKKVCIYRVPQSIKLSEPEHYEPQIISFGPYHSSNPKLREADVNKWRALHCMLKRNSHEVAQYLDAVKEHEQRARSCYEEEISLSSDQFVEMMVLDGCFIIECLLYQSEFKDKLSYPDNIPLFIVEETMSDFITDMLLVENQIPLFVLQILARMQTNPCVDIPFIQKEATSWFNLIIFGENERLSSSLINEQPFHILDMVIKSQVFDKSKLTENGNMNEAVIPCASKLKKAGVKFKAREDNLDWLIDFSERTLKLPKHCFQGDTEKILYNAVAYEQRHPGCAKVIIPYCIFMSQLIRSPKDVDHLTEAKIIQNLKGSNEELVELFSNIFVVFDYKHGYLCSIAELINTHYYTKWNKWKADLKDTHFSNPWVFISLLAAIFIIILTFTQTFFTVFPRNHK